MEETPTGSVEFISPVIRETPEDERAKRVREDVTQKPDEKGMDMKDVPRFLPKEHVKSISGTADPNRETKTQEHARKLRG
jgi:hypothetical protein